jgi:uncharacterized protein
MISHPLEQIEPTVGHTELVVFTGDNVRLAGQMDYPNTPPPINGFPMMFIIQHATCTIRGAYQHYVRLGTEQGMAVFRWDKRGTGSSGSGSGDTTLDTIHAFATALKQPSIDRRRVIIIAQNEGSMLLAEAWQEFKKIQAPAGVILAGNMLDEREILTLDVPIQAVMSKNDWNAWQIYGEKATQAHHQKYPQFPQSFFVAPSTNRRLLYENGGSFHRGASDSMQKWLFDVCRISPFN